MNKTSLLFLLLIPAIFVHGQGKINLMNGKIIAFDTISKGNMEKFNYVSHDTKKVSAIKVSRIFSINYNDGKEELFFVADSTVSDFSVPQMREFVKGEQDCRLNYKPKAATVGGIIVGGAAGILGIFYGPVLPAIYATIVSASPPPDITKKPYADKILMNSDYYAYGFEMAARKKKLKNSLLGGGIGFGISVTAFIIFRPKH